jgi:hypothetical protein
MEKNTQKSKFGFDQISAEGPEWASWIFRSYFIISKAVLGWLAYTHLIPQTAMYEVMGIIMFLADPIMLGISKMFGIVPEPVDPAADLVADKQIKTDGSTEKINPVIVENKKVPNNIQNTNAPASSGIAATITQKTEQEKISDALAGNTTTATYKADFTGTSPLPDVNPKVE